MRLLITGSTGFVGSHLTPHLASLGHELTLLQRNRVQARAGTVVIGTDIRRVTPHHLQHIECVIHLAAIAHQPNGPADLIHEVNTLGTSQLVSAAKAAGVGRFVFLSSVKALGERSEEPLSITAHPQPEDDYGVSKRESERCVLEAYAGQGAVIRVPLIYGAGVKGNFAQLIRLAKTGVPLPLAGVNNQRSLLGTDNLLSFISRLVQSDGFVPGIHHVTDPSSVSLPEIITQIRAAFGMSPRLFKVPDRVLGGALSLLPGVQAEKLIGNLELDCSETMAATGWSPPFTFAEQIGAVVR